MNFRYGHITLRLSAYNIHVRRIVSATKTLINQLCLCAADFFLVEFGGYVCLLELVLVDILDFVCVYVRSSELFTCAFQLYVQSSHQHNSYHQLETGSESDSVYFFCRFLFAIQNRISVACGCSIQIISRLCPNRVCYLLLLRLAMNKLGNLRILYRSEATSVCL